jgi:hypothetical protein
MVTLTPGTHTLNIFDEFGDGWNDGGGFAISQDGIEIQPETTFSDGFQRSFDFTIGVVPPSSALPLCMRDCANQPEDNSQASLCKFRDAYDLNEDCFADCDASSQPYQSLLEMCSALGDVFEHIMDGSVDPHEYANAMSYGSIGAVSSYVYSVQESSSFTIDPLDPALPADTVPIFGTAEDFGEAAVAQFPEVETAAAGSGSGSGSGSGAVSSVSPFADDDFMANAFVSSALLMKSQEQAAGKGVSAKFALHASAAVVGVCMGAALVVMAMRRRELAGDATPAPSTMACDV